jgi:hypothetical protein
VVKVLPNRPLPSLMKGQHAVLEWNLII